MAAAYRFGCNRAYYCDGRIYPRHEHMPHDKSVRNAVVATVAVRKHLEAGTKAEQSRANAVIHEFRCLLEIFV